MAEREPSETSAFTSVGRAEEFPPTYADSKLRHLFSTWTKEVLLARIIQYERFQANDKIWKSARTLADVALNLRHLRLEWSYQKGPEVFADWIALEKLETGERLEMDDCPTEPIDSDELQRRLAEA